MDTDAVISPPQPAEADASSAARVGRIGCVPYLNAKPLIYGLEGKVALDVPASLSRNLRDGRLEAALIPVAEYMENPRYQIVRGIAIGCRGPARSIYLASRKTIPQIQTLALDTASKTSNLLARVILAEFFRLTPRCQVAGSGKFCDAQLLIGDPALQARDRLVKDRYEIFDIGSLWQQKVRLPMVLAFWAVREGLDPVPYQELLTQAKQDGLQHLDEIISSQTILSKETAREYLTQNIRYQLGAEELTGLLKFQQLCVKHRLIPQTAELKFIT
ncbi:MAG: menaquinone biosynthesis protein [Verrucomicrobia bacterium]|nr:menaquinone biosynthesis protein [Verrucomicrobiota bacterium]